MPIKFGSVARMHRSYHEEANFFKRNGFELLQIWYDRDGIFKKNRDNEQIDLLKSEKFPFILHALLDLSEIEEQTEKLIDINRRLDKNELIIHPVCKSKVIDSETIYQLSEKISKSSKSFQRNGIKLFFENNSTIDPIFHTAREIEIFFENNPDVGFLLDLAHVDSYEQMSDIIAIRMPEILHLTDRDLSILHHHVPVGHGNINFTKIFNGCLRRFSGRIIFELVAEDEVIVDSKNKIARLVRDLDVVDSDQSPTYCEKTHHQ